LRTEPFQDSWAERAKHLQRTEGALVESVEDMTRRFPAARTRDELVKDIKATMHVPLAPYNLTVVQTLMDRAREEEFNQSAAAAFPAVRKEFGEAIQDFVVSRAGKTPSRRVKKTAAKTWKQDSGADRRVRNAAPEDDISNAYKGRPEKYSPEAVWAFADAIARTAGCEHFSIGHHGDATITDEGGGAMLRVLVAAVRWGMTAAWLGAAPPGTAPPIVKPEGILALIKRGR
jgi:hypothetical protein